MSQPRTTRVDATIGLAVGIVLLALVAVFAIFLPKAHGDDIALPDEVDGWKAADIPHGQLTAEQATRLADAREFADGVLDDNLDVPADTRTYVDPDLQQAVLVQAFRTDGGPYVPLQLESGAQYQVDHDPIEIEKKGDVVCQLNYPISQDPTSGQLTSPETPQVVACQRSEGDLTVRASGAGDSYDRVVEIVDTVFSDLS